MSIAYFDFVITLGLFRIFCLPNNSNGNKNVAPLQMRFVSQTIRFLNLVIGEWLILAPVKLFIKMRFLLFLVLKSWNVNKKIIAGIILFKNFIWLILSSILSPYHPQNHRLSLIRLGYNLLFWISYGCL